MTDHDTEPPVGDPSILVDIVRGKMPFGKYAGQPYMHMPEPYLTWFSQQGWPKGRLGVVLATLHEIKINGLDGLLRDVRRRLDEEDSHDR